MLFGLPLTQRNKRSCFCFSDLEVLSALQQSSSLRNLEEVFSVLWGMSEEVGEGSPVRFAASVLIGLEQASRGVNTFFSWLVWI